MVLLGLLGDVHKDNIYLELKVIVEHREISIGDSIIWSFASFSFYASIRQTTPIVENLVKSPKNLRIKFFGDEQKGRISTGMRHHFRPRVSGFLEQRKYTY